MPRSSSCRRADVRTTRRCLTTDGARDERRRPAGQRRDARAHWRRHTSGRGAAATIATVDARGPERLRPGRARSRRDGRAGRGDQGAPATRPRWSSGSVRSTPACSPSTAAPLRAALEPRCAPTTPRASYYLPDVLPILREHERTVDALRSPTPESSLGINDRVQLAEVAAIAQRADPRAPHARRRHDRQPRGDGDRRRRRDRPGHGDRAVHERCAAPPGSASGSTIGPGSTLIDATVGDGSTVLHAYVTGAAIGDRVSVGPFAYLRPGTVLREGSKAGTFVEIKNSDIGAGTKVPHLSYIGDADIGEETNLGAATITANYDGYRKHRTTIGTRREDQRRHDADGAGEHRRRGVHRRRIGDRPGRAAGRARGVPGRARPAREPSRATPSGALRGRRRRPNPTRRRANESG